MSEALRGVIFVFVFYVVVVMPLVALWWTSRRRPGQTDMVLVGATAGPAELQLWRSSLRRAGIKTYVQNVGDSNYWGPAPYSYEVWVRAKDGEAAKHALGL